MDKAKPKVGFIGIGVGAIALLLALTHFWAGPFAPRPTLEQTVAEKAVAIKQATVAALKGQEATTKKRRTLDADNVLEITTATLGGLAIILGVVSVARNEPFRVAGGAAVLGGIAIAFQFVAFALGAIIIAILIAVVLSQIGIA